MRSNESYMEFLHSKSYRILFALAVVATWLSCKPGDGTAGYVTLEGQAENYTDSVLVLLNGENAALRSFDIRNDGTFGDTITLIQKGVFSLVNSDGSQGFPLFLRNGDKLHIKFNAEDINSSIDFSGTGEENNEYLKARMQLQSLLFNEINGLYDLDKQEFDSALTVKRNEVEALADGYSSLDSLLLAQDKEGTDQLFGYFRSNYEYMSRVNDLKGRPSPGFENYENYNGDRTSLSDFRNKYVYIDIWATWCAPCWREVPYLKELHSEFKDSNIEFVGISVDNQAQKAAWREAIERNQLAGVQLLAPSDFRSEFVQGYMIRDIPRFILIGPDGNIIDPNAPRPSDPALRQVFLEISGREAAM